jgi:septal ring factor EnvC (AmiA/AmiB activator)
MQAQLDTTNASLNQANAALSISQLQLKRLEAAAVPEKAAHDAAEKKQDELTAKIIQNLTPLQIKLKIHPTLEEQLNPPASAVPAAPVAAAAPAPAAQKPEPKPKKPEPKQSPRVKSMLDAIHKFNEQ